MSVVLGWFLVLLLTGVIFLIGWWQWKSYVTLDQRIEQMDATLLESAGTRVEKVLDAPAGSVVVPYVASTLVPVQQITTTTVAPVGDQSPAVRLIQD
jgi:hypothetical protein